MKYLEKYEIERAKMCINNILDKSKAIEIELFKDKPYKDYLLEKLKSIEWDYICLKNMCDMEDE